MSAVWFRLCFVGVLIGACLPLVGCASKSSDTDAEFADLDLDEETSRILKAPEESGERDRPKLPTEIDPPLKGELGLRLSVGNKFPLQKRVEQRLTQPSEKGESTGHSILDLMLSLVVEEINDGRTRFGVHYHRVRYLEQNTEGKTIEYNSTMPQRDVPPEARVYAGMVDNGFSFWINAENRVVDLVGFDDFVQRCVRDVPPNQRQPVIDQLTAGKGANGIASFIDDSIGLLPVSTDPNSSRVAVQEGTAWDLPNRQIDGPVPMTVSTRCKIKGLTERTAEIDLFGSIQPTKRIEKEHGWKVSVLGGRCMGSCSVDRTTGLPTNSRVESYVDMMLELPDGTQLPQRKATITMIHAFLDQQGQPTQAAAGSIRPIGFESPNDSATQSEATAAPIRAPRPSSDELRLFR